MRGLGHVLARAHWNGAGLQYRETTGGSSASLISGGLSSLHDNEERNSSLNVRYVCSICLKTDNRVEGTAYDKDIFSFPRMDQSLNHWII